MTKKDKKLIGVVGGVLAVAGLGNIISANNKKSETLTVVEGTSMSSKETTNTPSSTAVSTPVTSSPSVNSSQQEESTSNIVSNTYSTIFSTPVSVPASIVSNVYSSTSPTSKPTPTPAPTQNRNYVYNTSTKKYHRPTCSQVKKIKPKNYATWVSDVEFRKYSPCKKCNP